MEEDHWFGVALRAAHEQRMQAELDFYGWMEHNTRFIVKQDSLELSLEWHCENIRGVFHLQVVAEVNNGKGEFMVSVKPKVPLCDGMFHKISGKIQSFTKDITGDKLKNVMFCIKSLSICFLVIKRKNVVQLHVDTIDNYKIGPPSSTTVLTKTPLYVGGIPGE